jgi:hypothetical protein
MYLALVLSGAGIAGGKTIRHVHNVRRRAHERRASRYLAARRRGALQQ